MPSRAEIKAKFHDLVKRHHPDSNGGDRSTEDRLIEIIQAYNYLKSVGFLLTLAAADPAFPAPRQSAVPPFRKPLFRALGTPILLA